MNFIEIRDDITLVLCDIIAPYVYQGFQSIYENALSYKKKNNVEFDELRIFQDLLRNIIPNWNNIILEREVARIKICSKKGDTLETLVKMIIKAQIYIYTSVGSGKFLKKNLYENINFNEFIHKIYINTARELFNNPFLFKTFEINPKEIKLNQKEALIIIKNCIKNTIKNCIPVELLLQELFEFDNEHVSVKLLTDEKINMSNIRKLELNKKVESEKRDVPLINTVGENVMDKVFSSFNIKETLPNLVDANDVNSVVSNTQKYNSHHTISNFLKQPPPDALSESIKQSAIDVYDAVYNNDN